MPAYADPPDGLGDSRMFSSISSLASNPASSRQQQSNMAKSYRQAAQLFLTRRLPEALSTIEPVITPVPTAAHGEARAGAEADANTGDEAEPQEAAPVASASRGTRIKVWSFYLTFLNAV
ncbi:MAG: hypothetical protein INR71_12645, partial [Terriglobus roseus]|nr:hypothetical protein [Terriglobus roseus]